MVVLLADAPASLRPYGLAAPARLLIPAYRPLIDAFTPEGRAEMARRAAEDAADQASADQALAAARAQWQAARESLAWNQLAVAVLDLHQPEGGCYSGPGCAECAEDNGGEAVRAPWPCRTFTAITGRDG